MMYYDVIRSTYIGLNISTDHAPDTYWLQGGFAHLSPLVGPEVLSLYAFMMTRIVVKYSLNTICRCMSSVNLYLCMIDYVMSQMHL